MERFKNYLVGVLMVLIILLLLKSGCNKPDKEIVEVEKVSVQIDTVYEKEVLVKFKSIYRPVHDTVYKLDTLTEDISSDTLFYVRKYNDSLVDSNITLYSNIKVIGILDKIDLSYKLKPKTIIKNIKKIETVYKPSRISAYSGVLVGTNKTISPYINLNSNKLSLTYSFELVNKTHSIGIGYRIFAENQ